jgi:predicted metal-dependent phosphotriesterase family hydrolase
MPEVSSVSGPLDTSNIGFTLMHEHILVQSPGLKENLPVMDRKVEIDKAAISGMPVSQTNRSRR